VAFSPDPKDAQISTSVFGGLVTEMAAPDLPEGVSPDCQDVVFQPGSVASRPGLQKVFATPFPEGGPSNFRPSIVYAKSFAGPTGRIANLYLDSNNILWWEDVLISPGIYTQLATLLGSWAKSITALNREYIATSDGLHGADIPLQWDGTNLDRVTQDGPGAPPAVQSIALPSVGLGSGPVIGGTVITECDPAGDADGNLTGFYVHCAASVASFFAGAQVTIAGSSVAFYNSSWTVTAVYPEFNMFLVLAYVPPATTFGTGGTATIASGVALVRQKNVVTAYTAADHQLQVGYQMQLAGVPTFAVGGGISSIVIDNEDNPGVATITTVSAHGLLPGIFVSIKGVTATAVGTGIAAIVRAGQIVTVTMNAAHGLSPGAIVTVAGVTAASFNSTVQVLNVVSSTIFTFIQVDVDATSSAGTVSINWPIPNSATPTYFEVLACPTTTKFQVAINYSDGTWASGAVSYAWNGTFYVSAVLSATAFQYQQYGPDATYTTTSGESVTPHGQAAPGVHQCQVLFLTRQGAITRPSPPVQVVAAGGQYLSVSNIPIGPANVIARILAFTGASGATFFYIPATPQVNGQTVGTSTQINDNVTTAALLDFSDPTLFAATGISIPGNNLANQIVLDSVLGFGFYAGRLLAWGMRNRIQNFLNLSFDGGQFSGSNYPCGWLVASGVSGGGALVTTGRWGWAWQPSGAGSIYQSAYQDAYGAPILTANTPYRFRAWIQGAATSLTATLSSASASFSATATVNGLTDGSFQEAAFSQAMPTPIPSDMILTLTWTGTPIVDELSVIYQDNPYLDSIIYASYVNNPEGIDGVTGKFGSIQDSRKVMDIADLRQTLYFLTQEPSGRLHETSDNGVTEPAGWSVNEVAANCGLLSAFGLTKSQADDASAAGGEEWFAWASSSGGRIFGGSQPLKLSQEIQPDWDTINPADNAAVWALNDPVARRIYFGLPLSPDSRGAPNQLYVMDYRGLNSAEEIGNTGPVRIGFTGRVVATDHSRKWTRWTLPTNGAALMYREAGTIQPVLFAGNGWAPGVQLSSGNVYTLNPAKLTDDDYGQIHPYYVTFFAPSHDQEQALQLGGGRKLLVYLQAFVSGVGSIAITPFCDALTNPWTVTGTRTLSLTPKYDLEWPGGNAQAQRIALKFASVPTSGTDNAFNLQKVVATLRRATHLPVRGAV
jgi:hypothetical protein